MEIQDFLIAAVQNIVILIRQSEKRRMSGNRGLHDSLHGTLCENPI
jgi:hypothetical protein